MGDHGSLLVRVAVGSLLEHQTEGWWVNIVDAENWGHTGEVKNEMVGKFRFPALRASALELAGFVKFAEHECSMLAKC